MSAYVVSLDLDIEMLLFIWKCCNFCFWLFTPAFSYAAYAPHMNPPHMTCARTCRAYDKRTKLIATAGYFVVIVVQLGLDLRLLELVHARVSVDVGFDVLRHGLRLPNL